MRTRSRKNSFGYLFMLFAVLGLFLGACSSKEEKIASFISKGDALLAEGDATRAILEYKNALQLDPKNPRAMVALGKAYLAKREYRKAYGSFVSALEVDANFDEARMEVASLLSLARQGERALKELASINNPTRFEPRFTITKARAFVSLEKYREAVEAVKKLKDWQQNREALLILSICYKELGQGPEMLETVSKWRKLDQKDPAPYLFMARYHLLKGNKEKAAQELRAMVEADPANIKLKLYQAQTLERLGLMGEAEKAYQALPDEPDTLKAKAAFWIRQKAYEKAKNVLESILQESPQDIQAVIMLAETLAAQGDMDKALAKLDSASKQDIPEESAQKLSLAQAKLWIKKGEIKKAKEICNDVLEKNQGNMEAHFLLGRILLSQGDLESAEVHLNQVAVAKPNHVMAQILLAKCQMLNNKEAVAGDTLKRALSNNPGNRQLHLELARYHLRKKEPEQALRVLDKALSIFPKDTLFLKLKGVVQTAKKDYEGAWQSFRKIIELRPDSPLGYMEMGRLMLAQKKYDQALNWFWKAYKTKDGWTVAVPAIIQTHAAAGNLQQALQVARKEASRRKDSPLAHYYLGRTLLAKRDFSGAEKALSQAIKLAPTWAEAYKLLAQLYLVQGKVSKAAREVEKIYNKVRSLPVGLNLAYLYEYSAKPQKAEKVYLELLQKHPKSPALLNNLAYLYAEHFFSDKKRLERAAEMILEALFLRPQAPNLLDTAAWIAYRQGKLNVAWNYLEDALEKDPETAVIYLHAAIVAHDLGKKELAFEYLEKAISQRLDLKVQAQAKDLKEKWGK